IFQQGEIVYTHGYGMANLELGVPIGPGSIFHVASISKQFAALSIALLAAEGKLSLDDDVRTYVPEVPDFGGERITIRQLIHHTSGLRDQWDLLDLAGWREDDLITDDDVLEITSRQRGLNFAPGDQYRYSNTGYTLLGIIVRRLTGQSLRQFAQERIFAPLGMTHTHFHDDHSEIVFGRTQAYEPREDGSPRVSIPVFDTTGATSLFTTVEDFFHWDQNFDLGTVGGELLGERLTPARLNDGQVIGYGFGLSLRQRGNPRLVGHDGADAGYRSSYVRVPEQGLAVVIFCNLSTMVPGTLADRVLSIFLGDEPGKTPPVEQPAFTERQLAGWPGFYRSRQSGWLLEVTAHDDGLFLQLGRELPLRPISQTPLRLTIEGWSNTTIEAEPSSGENGPRALLVTQSGGMIERFDRVADEEYAVKPLNGYTGRYYSDELDTSYGFAVRDNDDGPVLYWQRKRFSDRPLRAVLNDTFIAGMTRFEFTRDGQGAVNGFSVNTMRSCGMRFERIE
ncbi:MAG TPA: serine hydrolase domain-containing protein, partial [Thermomicrobiaceae bacterium]|nr:serine hydrolase domain-containing protein [Thermomicrobiaceae bacterium]